MDHHGEEDWVQERFDRLRRERRSAEAALKSAREQGDAYGEARALASLVGIAYALGDVWAMISCAEEAWALAEAAPFPDQLARLSLLFGDVAYSGEEYQRCYDHYANACAYGAMVGPEHLGRAVARIDGVLAELLSRGRGDLAADFCEMLVAYEAAGGLGGPAPGFAAHFRGRLALARAQGRASPSLAA